MSVTWSINQNVFKFKVTFKTCVYLSNKTGEDPKGDWHIVVANNPDDETDVSSFGSDSNNDVESLEEDVIDAQMKSKQKEWDQRREKVTYNLSISLVL